MVAEKQLVSVKTGEPYQPVRIYFQVFKKKTVLSAFQKLKCIEYGAIDDRWNWLFEAEAKKLRFQRPYSTLKPSDKPLILGYFTFRGDDQMLLDLRSLERATHALDFFEKRINRYAANPTHMRLVNRLFSVAEMPNREIHPSLDPFFEREDVVSLAQEMEQRFAQISADYADDPEAKEKAFTDYMDQQMERPHPEIEELLIHPDKLDRLGLPMALQMRQVEAFEHWRGNFTFRASQLIRQWTDSVLDEVNDDEFIEALEAEGQAAAPETAEKATPDEEALSTPEAPTMDAS